MTIYEMLFREDIYGIMERTLTEYYEKVYHEDVEVKVEKSVFKNFYIIYPRLGVAMARIPSVSVLRDIYSQFNVQGNVLRKLAAWGYITLCVMTFGLIGSRSLRISKKAFRDRKVYIMPCNRKIRIFNYREDYVDAILKEGFSDNNFRNELLYRNNPEFDFIPGIIEHGERWYREAIVKGTGLVRMPEPAYSEKVEEIKALLKPFYEKDLHCVEAFPYCDELAKHVLSKLPELKEKKHIETTEYIRSVIEKCLEMVKNSQTEVPVVVSHGDLQTGNILVESKTGKACIYDWETASERSIWYDMGRFLLYSQRKDKYAYMVNHCKDAQIKDNLLVFDANKERDMDVVIAILILEEFVAFTDEICDLPRSMGTEIMDRLTDELKQTKYNQQTV